LLPITLTLDEELRMNKQERKILFFTSITHFLTHFYVLVFPALVMPISRDFGLPIATVLNISFWMYLLYGLLALAWGWVSDHWGHKWAMACGILLASFGFVLAGIVRSVALVTVAFAMVGVGSSAYHPSGIALVSQGIRERGRAMGINGVWGNVGIASVPFVVGLLNYLIGWRTGLIALGSVGVAVGIASLATPFSIQKHSDVISVKKLESRVALRLFIVFCFGVTFAGFMYRSYTVILPVFFEARLGNISQLFQNLISERVSEVKNVPAFQTLVANLIATCVYLLGIIGQVIGGRVADRHSLKWAYFISFSCALPFIAAVVLLQNVFLIPAAGFFLLFVLGIQPIENSLLAYLTPARWRSMSYGIKFTLTFGAGAFAVKLVSLVEGRYGIGGGMYLAGGFLVLVIVCVSLFIFLSRGYTIRH